MTLKGLNPYKTDEGGDVSPAVLHQQVWTITNHVCDVTVETLSTFRKVLGIRNSYFLHVRIPNVYTDIFALM